VPYINEEGRKFLDPKLDEIYTHTPGELNYVVTSLVDAYINSHVEDPNYARYNEAIGVLECAKLELYRRLVAPYEDKKILENGDVFRYTVDTKERNEPQ